jgi:hypothetical protein
MKSSLLALMFTAGSLFAETHISIGIGIGTPFYYAPPPPPIVAYTIPPCPGPGYLWIAGYWYPAGSRYRWRDGYWARPPYPGSYWVAPRYYKQRYYSGYWERGGRTRYRVEDRGRGRGNDHGRYRDRGYDSHRGSRQNYKRRRR